MAALSAPLPALWPAAVAVSGGGDSVALMLLLRDWAKTARRAAPVVLTVDHRLRQGSAADAAKVLGFAKAAGLEAHRLTRKGDAPGSDIEAFAREARYRLIGQWAQAHGVKTIFAAHTQDDQAETFLLRLARGSGLDGLSAMRALAPYPLAGMDGLVLARPLLGFGRDELRAWLAAQGQDWIEDPMNGDPRFARVRIRQSWPALEAAGLGRARLAAAADHLARARAALDAVTAAVLERAVRKGPQGLLFHGPALATVPREVGLRALARILMEVSGRDYRPRFERLERLFDALAGPFPGATLHGCRIGPAPRAGAVFGPGTLLVRPESARKSGG